MFFCIFLVLQDIISFLILISISPDLLTAMYMISTVNQQVSLLPLFSQPARYYHLLNTHRLCQQILSKIARPLMSLISLQKEQVNQRLFSNAYPNTTLEWLCHWSSNTCIEIKYIISFTNQLRIIIGPPSVFFLLYFSGWHFKPGR
jgi:hypothetical protein